MSNGDHINAIAERLALGMAPSKVSWLSPRKKLARNFRRQPPPSSPQTQPVVSSPSTSDDDFLYLVDGKYFSTNGFTKGAFVSRCNEQWMGEVSEESVSDESTEMRDSCEHSSDNSPDVRELDYDGKISEAGNSSPVTKRTLTHTLSSFPKKIKKKSDGATDVARKPGRPPKKDRSRQVAALLASSRRRR